MKYSTTIKSETKKELSTEDKEIYQLLLRELKYDREFLSLKNEDQIRILKLRFEIERNNNEIKKIMMQNIKNTNEKEPIDLFPSRSRSSKLSI